jgi:hypothetical protein
MWSLSSAIEADRTSKLRMRKVVQRHIRLVREVADVMRPSNATNATQLQVSAPAWVAEAGQAARDPGHEGKLRFVMSGVALPDLDQTRLRYTEPHRPPCSHASACRGAPVVQGQSGTNQAAVLLL